MRSNIGLLAGLTFLALSSLACSKIQSAASDSVASKEVATPSEAQDSLVGQPIQSGGLDKDQWVNIPLDFQFRGVANVESASSWSQRVAKYPEDERKYLEDVNGRYYGALDFSSNEEQRRLVQQGFPMPEEWLAARDLPDAELERLAMSGSAKAQMFFIDRVSERIGPVLAVRGLDQSPADKAIYHQFVQASTMAGMLIRNTGSPFAAYLHGRLLSSGTSGHQMEPIAASFQVARELGDLRADAFQSAFFAGHPGLDAQAVMASYTAMKPGAKR